MLAKEAKILMDYAKDQGAKFNEWEERFIASINNMPQEEKLTYKQMCAAQVIYAKATGGGRYIKRQYAKSKS